MLSKRETTHSHDDDCNHMNKEGPFAKRARQLVACRTQTEPEQPFVILNNIFNVYWKPIPPEPGLFVVFDTETSGLNVNDYVVQIAYMLCNMNGESIFQYESLWKLPFRCKMSRQSMKVHKITYEMLKRDAKPTKLELQRLEQFHRNTQKHNIPWVAHNAKFDRRMIKQTAYKFGVEMKSFEHSDTYFCTLEESAKRLENLHVGGIKRSRLKNSELYKYLTNNSELPKDIKLHDALGDCKITAWNYVHGRKRWKW